MLKVYTHTDRPGRRFAPTGDGTIKTYQEEIKNGRKQLTHIGFHNVYEEIQIDVENCMIENILHQVAMGDYSALQAREATYVDVTTMPKSLMEAQNLVIRMKDEFEKMPIDIRKEFGNSADKYVEMMGTKEFQEIMAPYNEKIAKVAAEKNAKEYERKVKEGAKLNYDIAREQKILEGGSAE